MSQYPDWRDLCDCKAEFWPSITQQPQSICRVELVQDRGQIMPAIVIKHPASSFRQTLTPDTGFTVLVNIDAVPPGLPALALITAVIFDDDDDPFWVGAYLNLFPVENDIGGIPVLHRSDYQPLEGRSLAKQFCRHPWRCAILVLDTDNQLLMARSIDFDEQQKEYLGGLGKVLDILPEQEVAYSIWKSAQDLHSRLFRTTVRNPCGKVIDLPKKICEEDKSHMILPVKAVGDRLVAGDADQVASEYMKGRVNDVFLSHAHADHKWATEIALWLGSIWPSIKVFQTAANDTGRFKEDRLFFTKELLRSRCVLFLATPRSVNRPWVEAEIGSAAGSKPLVTLAVDGITRDQLAKDRKQDPYSNIDLDRLVVVDGQDSWERLARKISRDLSFGLPETLPPGPVFKRDEIEPCEIKNPSSAFLDEYRQMTLTTSHQTESEAELLLEQIECELGIDECGTQNLPLRSRLLCLLQITNDVSKVNGILDYFPALVDAQLVAKANQIINSIGDANNEMHTSLNWIMEVIQTKLR